jgi:hypothetical protein
MLYWEILLIERGYYHRNVLMYQLQRLTAYSAAHCMSGDKENKGPVRWRPLYIDRYKSDTSERISRDEVQELQREIDMINLQRKQTDAD